MDAVDLWLLRYASIHDFVADDLVEGLTEAQVRGRPVPGVNPIAWLIWHALRVEDVCVNRFVLDRPQVLDAGDSFFAVQRPPAETPGRWKRPCASVIVPGPPSTATRTSERPVPDVPSTTWPLTLPVAGRVGAGATMEAMTQHAAAAAAITPSRRSPVRPRAAGRRSAGPDRAFRGPRPSGGRTAC